MPRSCSNSSISHASKWLALTQLCFSAPGQRRILCLFGTAYILQHYAVYRVGPPVGRAITLLGRAGRGVQYGVPRRTAADTRLGRCAANADCASDGLGHVLFDGLHVQYRPCPRPGAPHASRTTHLRPRRRAVCVPPALSPRGRCSGYRGAGLRRTHGFICVCAGASPLELCVSRIRT